MDLIISSPELVIANCSSVKLITMHSTAEYVSILLNSPVSLCKGAVNVSQRFVFFFASILLGDHKSPRCVLPLENRE